MPHCCKSYIVIQIQLTVPWCKLKLYYRIPFRERKQAKALPSCGSEIRSVCASVCHQPSVHATQSRIDFFSAEANLRRIGRKFTGPKRIQMQFLNDILVGDLPQQAYLNAGLAKLSAFMLEL